jgi:hypothetical protein
MGAEVLDLLVHVLVQEVLDSPTSGKKMALRMRSILYLVSEAFRAPFFQDVFQFSVFVRSFACVLPKEPADIHVCMQRRLEHQELW